MRQARGANRTGYDLPSIGDSAAADVHDVNVDIARLRTAFQLMRMLLPARPARSGRQVGKPVHRLAVSLDNDVAERTRSLIDARGCRRVRRASASGAYDDHPFDPSLVGNGLAGRRQCDSGRRHRDRS